MVAIYTTIARLTANVTEHRQKSNRKGKNEYLFWHHYHLHMELSLTQPQGAFAPDPERDL